MNLIGVDLYLAQIVKHYGIGAGFSFMITPLEKVFKLYAKINLCKLSSF